MNSEAIATTILFCSLIGIGVVVFRKIPMISKLPEVPAEFNLKKILLKIREKIKIFNPFRYFLDKIFLQKILSKIRILTLKIENKTAGWLQKLREHSLKEKIEKNDNYWEKLKKSTNKKR